MRLSAEVVSVVGGGLMLLDEMGATRFIVAFMSAGGDITKEQTEALASQFAFYVNNHDVTVSTK